MCEGVGRREEVRDFAAAAALGMLAFGNSMCGCVRGGGGKSTIAVVSVVVVVMGRWVDEIMEDSVGLGLVWFGLWGAWRGIWSQVWLCCQEL